MRYVLAASIFLITGQAHAQFALDADDAALRKANKVKTIGELSIGEMAEVFVPIWCVVDGKVFVSKESEIHKSTRDPEFYPLVTTMKREAGGFSLQQTERKNRNILIKEELISRLQHTMLCGENPLVNNVESDLEPLISINGAKSAQELIKSK